MNGRWIACALVSAACKGGDPANAPSQGSAAASQPPADPVAPLVARCAPAKLAPRATVFAGGARGTVGVVAAERARPAEPPPVHVADTREWTPFAAGDVVSGDDVVGPAAVALDKAIRERIETFAACFPDTRSVAVRAVLNVAFDGGVIAARAGGAGDHAIEACMATHLIGLKAPAPPVIVEVACDFVRGDPQPWRVTPDAGYVTLEVTSSEIRRDGKPVDARQPLAGVKHEAETSFLVIAEPGAPGALLDQALALTSESSATVVAVHASGGAPVYLAMGGDGRTFDYEGERTAVAVDTHGPLLRGCVGDDTIATSHLAPRELDVMFAAIASKCRTTPCATTVNIGLDGKLVAKDLFAITEAARRGGFDRVLLGTGCVR